MIRLKFRGAFYQMPLGLGMEPTDIRVGHAHDPKHFIIFIHFSDFARGLTRSSSMMILVYRSGGDFLLSGVRSPLFGVECRSENVCGISQRFFFC
jgi:hypothetical protein